MLAEDVYGIPSNKSFIIIRLAALKRGKESVKEKVGGFKSNVSFKELVHRYCLRLYGLWFRFLSHELFSLVSLVAIYPDFCLDESCANLVRKTNTIMETSNSIYIEFMLR